MKKLLDSGMFRKKIVLKRNDYLKTIGTVDTNVYFVESGSLRIFIVDEGEERTVRFGYRENVIVSLDSYISGQHSDFIIQALKHTVVWAASKSDVMEFVAASAENIQLYQQILEDLVMQQIEREKDLLTNSPGKRYERVLKRSPQLFQEVSNKHIANYLRMTPETLSRLKKS